MCAPTGDITGGSIVGVAEKVGEGPGGAARPGRRLGCRNLQGAEMGAGSRGGARPLLVLRPPLPASPAAAATTQEHSEQEQAAQRADLRGWCRSARSAPQLQQAEQHSKPAEQHSSIVKQQWVGCRL